MLHEKDAGQYFGLGRALSRMPLVSTRIPGSDNNDRVLKSHAINLWDPVGEPLSLIRWFIPCDFGANVSPLPVLPSGLPSRAWCSTPVCSVVRRRTFRRDRLTCNCPIGRSPRRSTAGSDTVALRRHWDTVRRTHWAAPTRAGSSSGTLPPRILHKRNRRRWQEIFLIHDLSSLARSFPSLKVPGMFAHRAP